MLDLFNEPWPWYIAGPLIGLMVPILLITGNKQFGISSSLRHICAACIPSQAEYFRYDWKSKLWNLMFVLGILVGGIFGGLWLDPSSVIVSENTVADLKALGVQDTTGYLPESIFSWENLLTAQGIIFMVAGGFMVGFGARYAGGCTSGHAIMGLSNLQLSSLIAVVGFFLGGLITTHLLLPYLL